MPTFDCPHEDCGGTVELIIEKDSDGDANVIGGIRHFWVAEIVGQTCKCEYTGRERDQLLAKAVNDWLNTEPD